MKNLKNILSAFVVVALFATSAFAQENTDVNIGAVVLADITLTKNDDVSFGNIQDTGSPVLDPQGTNTADVGNAATFGKLTITAALSTQLLIDWDKTTVTLGDGTTNTMTFTPDFSGNSSDDIATSTDITKNTASAATETDGTTGELYVYIGGNLGTLSSQTAATYSSSAVNGDGDLNVTVNYQ